MNKELKEQAHKELIKNYQIMAVPDRKSIEIQNMMIPQELYDFIDSLIDKTVQMTEEHYKEEIKRYKQKIKDARGYLKRKSLGKHIVNDSTMRNKYPERYKARYELRNAVRYGKIEKLPCEVCGDVKSQGHHEDYSKPLEVIWLCTKHHKEIHKGVDIISLITNKSDINKDKE